jgi:hypothetical protein
MAPDEKKEIDEGAEFADFMADISQEISQRVESLDAALPPRSPTPERKVPRSPVASEAGMIVDWDNIADRMLEEMV